MHPNLKKNLLMILDKNTPIKISSGLRLRHGEKEGCICIKQGMSSVFLWLDESKEIKIKEKIMAEELSALGFKIEEKKKKKN